MSDIVAFVPMRALDANGVPVPGALAYFYQSGTSTPVTVYSDVAETVPHTTPVVADGSGVFPPVYRSGVALKCDVTDPDDVPLPGYPIDPLIAVGAASSAASEISFNATGDIPETNVQDAIERVQANIIEPLAEYGLGITGDAPDIANLDLTTHATGFYRFTATTTGTRPSGWVGADTGTVEVIRYNANNAWMIAKRTSDNVVAHRRLQTGSWQAWQVGFFDGAGVYQKTNILGSVTESAGVPTGAVIERGSNANGDYVKFADGTMICTHTVSFANISTALGGIFASTALTWTFPVTFVSGGATIGSVAVNNADSWGNAHSPTTTQCTVRAFAAASKAFAIPGYLTATGRWF